MSLLYRRVCLIIFIFLPFIIHAKTPHSQKICLNMIVKDESKVIRRCLESVKPLIDYWVIVDTGSTDGTQAIIKEFMKDIPGELHEKKWVDFAHNRNEALLLAKNKGEYFLFIDADEQLVFDSQFKMPYLDKDCYSVIVRVKDSCFARRLLVKNELNWSWIGVIHEGIWAPEAKTSDILKNIENNAMFEDGKRSQDPLKHAKDAKILEKALENEPDNSRYVYYLAQEYLSAQNYELALKNYQKRAGMGGSEEEVFFSLFATARLQEILKMPKEMVVASYSKAYEFRPTRPEPLFYLALFYFRKEEFLLSYVLTKHALSLPPHTDTDYIEESITDYLLPALLFDSSYKLGFKNEAKILSHQLLQNKKTPKEICDKIQIFLKL